MRSRFIVFIFLFIPCIFVAIIILFPHISKVFCKGLDCIIFEGSNKYKIKEVYQDQGKEFKALYNNKNNLARVLVISKIEKNEAEKQLETSIFGMKRLFQKERSPYPGEISDAIECGQDFIPTWNEKIINEIKTHYTTAFLNDRFVYGGCTDSQIKYQALFFTFYCEDQQKLYQIEVIDNKIKFEEKKENYLNILNSLQCK